MRCHNCGNRVADGQVVCPTCHASMWAFAPVVANKSTRRTVAAQDDSSWLTVDQTRQYPSRQPSCSKMVLRLAESAVALAASSVQSALVYVIPAKRSVSGRVIIADPACSEDPDTDVCKVLTRIMWLIMLLPFLIGAGLVCLLFRRFAPINLFAMLGIFRFLNPAARNTVQVPVRYFRIRENGSDDEVMVRMKGKLTGGNLGQEDIVTLSGRYRGGTLYATHGHNHRTSSTIRVARSYSWVGLVLTLLFILYLVVRFYEPTAKIGRTISSLGGAQ